MRLFRLWDRRARQSTPHRPLRTRYLSRGERGSTYRLIPSKEIGALLRILKSHAIRLGTCYFPSRDNGSIRSRIVFGGLGRTAPQGGFSPAAAARPTRAGLRWLRSYHSSEESHGTLPAPSYYSCGNRGSGLRGPDQLLGWSPEICSSTESSWVS
jgi:hypothetical protein